MATDCCTHAIELSLRLDQPDAVISVPEHTYISVPFTLIKLNTDWVFANNKWANYYRLGNTRIYDAAVYYQRDGYKNILQEQANPLVCLSFQFKKPLSLGRGGAILCSNEEDYVQLKKLTYDGRYGDTGWATQDISSVGYHYYMTPETAQQGLCKLKSATANKEWNYTDYPHLPDFNVFKNLTSSNTNE